MRIVGLALLSVTTRANAQPPSIAPIPLDPLELVTGQTQVPADSSQLQIGSNSAVYGQNRAVTPLRAKAVLKAQINSVRDADPSNLTIYTPTAQMMAQGAALLSKCRSGSQDFSPPPPVPLQRFNPVIVHTTLIARSFHQRPVSASSELTRPSGRRRRLLN